MSQAEGPRNLVERAREFARGGMAPAVPRDAATVMLLREAPDVEAFLLQRTEVLEFAPGACVFPGGSVDEGDTDPAIGWTGPSPADFAGRLGTSPERARALVCAAVRETFEESGVLLAGPKNPRDAVLDDSAALAQDRRALLDGSVSLGDLLRRRGLVLRADLLTPWARWITPELSPRRFDTWFFATVLPSGQTAALAALAGPRRGGLGTGFSGVGLGNLVAAVRGARRGPGRPDHPAAADGRDPGRAGGAPGRGRHPGRTQDDHPADARGDRRGRGAMAFHAASHGVPDLSEVPAASIDGFCTPRATCLLAPNPSPMTLDGTNTWLIAEPGSSSVVVVDPGPDEAGHLGRVHAAAVAGDRRVAKILLTHGHLDHSAGAARLAGLTGALVQAADPAHRLGPEGLADGDVVTAAGCELRVVATPGHSADSVCLLLPADGALFTGDTVLGRGTTVIATDGNLGDYLRTLGQLRDLAESRGLRLLLPGHGPMLADPLGTLDYYLSHRAERLDQVRSALAAGARTPAAIVAMIYTDVDQSVWPAAEWSVRAQLDYLNER
jgi:glyoxylase-like metal-dependent hydrolase (beta-lactamase superfamily II)/8-oxo-dGTP pyrophosphatase MutT (NUDIX family)